MNPFRFGHVVSGEFFTDRARELKALTDELKSGQHVVLISPRRYGKSSLVNRVLEGLGQKWFRVDMELIAGEMDLAAFYVRKALLLSRFERVKRYLKGLRVQPSIQFQPTTNDLSVSFTPASHDVSSVLSDSLDLPEAIAKGLGERIVIVFDEFQDVRRISPMLERKMRGVFQYHEHVTYLFIGSQESMIRDIFQDKKNPFYKFARQMTLRKIPRDDLAAFVLERFSSQGRDARGIVSDILGFTDEHPYYTQQLCHEIFNLSISGSLRHDVIAQAIAQVVSEHHADFSRWWRGLSNTERKIMLGVANGEGKTMSHDFIARYGIKSTSTSGSATVKLVESGNVVRSEGNGVRIEDPFWGEWIKARRAAE